MEVLLSTDSAEFELNNGDRGKLKTGLSFPINQIKSIQIHENDRVYLRIKNQIFFLDNPGIYNQSSLTKKKSSTYSGFLRFLKETLKPTAFISKVITRNDEQLSEKQKATHFQKNWEALVYHLKRETSLSVSYQELTATGAWFLQNKQTAKAAYIFDFLSSSLRENPVYRGYRNETIEGVPLEQINKEVEITLKSASVDHTRFYALLIGIEEYQNPHWERLSNPLNDIASIRKLLVNKYSFQQSQITTLVNPDYRKIIKTFNELKSDLDKDSRLLIYYAGHGYYPKDEGEGYWIPSNAGNPDDQSNFLATSVVLSKIKSLKTKQTLLLADACFSGSLIRKQRGSGNFGGYFQDLYKKKSRQIITSGGLEPVLDEGRGNHSIFAGNLIDILSQDRKEPISASELAVHLRKAIKNQGANQTPEYGRLWTDEDENGEFFFIAQNSVPATLSPAPFQYPEEKNLDKIQEYKEQPYIALEGGLYFHEQNFQYNYLSTTNDSNDDTKIEGSISGTGIIFKTSWFNDPISLNLYAGLGNYSSLKQCDSTNSNSEIVSCDEDYGNKENKDANATSVSGQFYQVGASAQYRFLDWRFIHISAGAGLEYQRSILTGFLEQDQMIIDSFAACMLAESKFSQKHLFASIFVNVCMTAFQTESDFNSPEDDIRSDFRLTQKVNAGIRFGKTFQ